MKVKKGHSRVVIVFPNLGIVFKLPIIHLLIAREIVLYYLKARRWRSLKKNWDCSIESIGGLKSLLFLGLVSNWREWWFYFKTRHDFLQPTLISILGLVNIQRYGMPVPKEIDVWLSLYDLTNGEIFKDGHHFTNSENFCSYNSGIRMLDYSSTASQKIVLKHGTKILKNFKPIQSPRSNN